MKITPCPSQVSACRPRLPALPSPTARRAKRPFCTAPCSSISGKRSASVGLSHSVARMSSPSRKSRAEPSPREPALWARKCSTQSERPTTCAAASSLASPAHHTHLSTHPPCHPPKSIIRWRMHASTNPTGHKQLLRTPLPPPARVHVARSRRAQVAQRMVTRVRRG
jgi:hypothetical protein